MSGPLWSPDVGQQKTLDVAERLTHPHPAGDHKGPPPIHTTTLAPTKLPIPLQETTRTRYNKIKHNQPQSWGRYPKIHNSQIQTIYWQNELPDLATYEQPILPYAYGRSYGDSCLNENGITLDLSHLQRFISFDQETGLLRCEAGVSLAEILDIFVPRGWFLPVTPGTKFVSVGGAIANDIHGKNHHRSGTFGCHVTCFELLRSNGQRLICSPDQNSELFRATIGGLGLTGVILWAEFRLKPIINPYIDMDHIRFSSLDEFFDISAASDRDFEYTMSWVDLFIGGRNLCRGIFMRGNHNQSPVLASKPVKKRLPLALPFNLPTFTLNTFTVKAFNELLYHAQTRKTVHKTVPYDPFFYPLDSIHHWYRMYGKRGFLQYQLVVPFDNAREAMGEILGRIRQAGEGSFLTVLKTFGDIPSPGMLSFPRPGLTLALDFAYGGQKTLQFLNELDAVVIQAGGALYPAKDARMSAQSFQTFYPQWKQFAQHIDPRFSSSFWRRVTKGSAEALPLPERNISNNSFAAVGEPKGSAEGHSPSAGAWGVPT